MGKTLADIAREIGVSVATVSRVLNNEGNVSPETRERVMAALEGLPERPRSRRRSVAMKNTDTVMIIAGQLTNPITLGYIDGLRQALAEEGIRCVISLSDYDSRTECSYIEYALANSYTGICLLNVVESEPLVRLLESTKIPVVLVNRYLRALDTDVVMVDNYRCGYMATQYLVQRGHRLIADDAVEIKRASAKALVGSAPEIIRHYVELRGIGLVDVRRLFGMGAVKDTEKIDLIISLEHWVQGKMYDRLGLDEEKMDILGIELPCITIPVKPGRNLAIIIEIAAMNNRLKKMGYNTAEEFNKKLMSQLEANAQDL